MSKKGRIFTIAASGLFVLLTFTAASAVTIDPLTIPKYVTPLVIPPVMNNDGTGANNYDIAVREFYQQILPGGIWNTVAGGVVGNFPPTKIWGYGPAADPAPDSSALGGAPGVAPAPNSQFNYPAYTFETMANVPVNVRWINDLVDAAGNPLPHLLSVDQTLHWANPGPTPCVDPAKTVDCMTMDPTPYTGAVPIVTHVHGAHVDPHSDGYPEAWWLPAGVDPTLYTSSGTMFDDATGANPGNLGYADYVYRQDQPATTLWYHDHALGMTRLNVYAGPAGFWLVRGDFTTAGGALVKDGAIDGATGLPAVLPSPAPSAGQSVLDLNLPSSPSRQALREIPIVIQDRSFNSDGSLFYPDNRAFFEGLNKAGTAGTPNEQFPGSPELDIPFVPGSDIAPIWNPEAFFDVMVVNGVSWPELEVAPAIYRFRLLNGCNSRFLNLALYKVKTNSNGGRLGKELPFYQIGAEQGFLPQTVEILTGKATPLAGDGLAPLNRLPGTFKDQGLLMGLAERADVLVDFRGLKDGDVIRMINTGPDAPYGGFPVVPANPATTGQVMQFRVNSALLQPSDANTTPPLNIIPIAEPANAAAVAAVKSLSLNEEISATLCVTGDAAGNLVEALDSLTGAPLVPPLCIDSGTGVAGGVPMAPKAATLGTFDPTTGISTPLLWSDPMTERPIMGDTEIWEVYNQTIDGHPIHLHLVRYEVVDRQLLDPLTNLPLPGTNRPPEPWETGYKDTVIAYPGEVTRLRAKFDVAGLYVWHCHIVEHEDNEMMRPYCVDAAVGVNSCPNVP